MGSCEEGEKEFVGSMYIGNVGTHKKLMRFWATIGRITSPLKQAIIRAIHSYIPNISHHSDIQVITEFR